uniref:hypothetical protein n=1 Tax=Pedobacter schmidteae TaxID=2201271 RepID=UPI000EB54F9C|nr:hypothetical protein [Pedobacter schmidteae]
MGKFDGKYLTGLVGDSISRRGKNGKIIVQSVPETIRHTKATKQASTLFGLGSVLAGIIRKDLFFLVRDNYDPDMINRFNKPVKDVLRQCYQPDTQTFHFAADSFARLSGFEFNMGSLLMNSLWVKPEMTLTGNTIKINLPKINVKEELKFPLRADVCELNIALALIALIPGLHKHPVEQTISISKAQQTSPAQEFTFEVPDGCLCVAGIGLQYFSLDGNVKTVLNSKSFNPANVCGAIITRGTFVKPPNEVTPNGVRGSEWYELMNLKLG